MNILKSVAATRPWNGIIDITFENGRLWKDVTPISGPQTPTNRHSARRPSGHRGDICAARVLLKRSYRPVCCTAPPARWVDRPSSNGASRPARATHGSSSRALDGPPNPRTSSNRPVTGSRKRDSAAQEPPESVQSPNQDPVRIVRRVIGNTRNDRYHGEDRQAAR